MMEHENETAAEVDASGAVEYSLKILFLVVCSTKFLTHISTVLRFTFMNARLQLALSGVRFQCA
jgi:hypothetical protein